VKKSQGKKKEKNSKRLGRTQMLTQDSWTARIKLLHG